MRQLFIKNQHAFQDRRKITASERCRVDAGYDLSLPCYNADIGDFPKAKYRFLILTFTEDMHLDEDTRPGVDCVDVCVIA